jgi:hypothetical protein
VDSRRYSGLLVALWALTYLALLALGALKHGAEAIYGLPAALLNMAPLCGAFLVAKGFDRGSRAWLVVALGMTAAVAVGGCIYWDFNIGPSSRSEPMLAPLYAPFIAPLFQLAVLVPALAVAWLVDRYSRPVDIA